MLQHHLSGVDCSLLKSKQSIDSGFFFSIKITFKIYFWIILNQGIVSWENCKLVQFCNKKNKKTAQVYVAEHSRFILSFLVIPFCDLMMCDMWHSKRDGNKKFMEFYLIDILCTEILILFLKKRKLMLWKFYKFVKCLENLEVGYKICFHFCSWRWFLRVNNRNKSYFD